MITTLLGMFFGLLFGAAVAGSAGAVAGVVLGLAAGLLVAGIMPARRRPQPGAVLERNTQPMLCVPRGQVADVTFVRDAQRGHWLDVEACTLCSPEDNVKCAKNCLLLIRDAAGSRQRTLQATS